ncbi:zinc-containing alcohol dehydrogenase superfamily protein [Microseira wollei NIES-4236]|uniref:Zinc-containing alcohol dehydrogenase superfamily protein n=1 Tax=Microseira wollei NIES-4236 TaxID=2530354 RepID=A0AAV3XL79_9CYAN|nr:zinc-containing alcohol dehydrogenase superfamily protein [Microseira wollei NIES-4236]
MLAVPREKAFFPALDVTRQGGKILFFAEFPEQVEIPINPNILYRREIDLMGSYSSSYRVQNLAIDIVFNRRIDVDALINDRYPLARIINSCRTCERCHTRNLQNPDLPLNILARVGWFVPASNLPAKALLTKTLPATSFLLAKIRQDLGKHQSFSEKSSLWN